MKLNEVFDGGPLIESNWEETEMEKARDKKRKRVDIEVERIKQAARARKKERDSYNSRNDVERRKSQQELVNKKQAEEKVAHERKMKDDPEYKKQSDLNGEAWADYGNRRRSGKDKSIHRRGHGNLRNWTGD